MDVDPLDFFGWRETLIAVIALLLLYVVVALLRVNRLRQAQAGPGVSDRALKSAIAAYAAGQEPVLASDVSDLPWAARPVVEAVSFGADEAAEPASAAVDSELDQLRREVGALRAEVMRLREEQKRELTEIREVQSISPVYSDAMQLAMQGHDAAMLAQHCGISRAEAELVVALVRNRDQ